jgi:CTP synthase
VIPAIDVKNIYEVPASYHSYGLDAQVLKYFGLQSEKAPNLAKWKEITDKFQKPKAETTVAIVGKYTDLSDAYKSLLEAIDHAGIANDARVKIKWVDATAVDEIDFTGVDAILVPGGFGERGARGKIAAVKYARENNVPYLGICFGMQLATIEVAQNLVGLKGASTTEFGPCDDPIVGLMTEWTKGNEKEKRGKSDDMGGTMRLGSYPCQIEKGTLAHKIYGSQNITERHRHRYEVNINYKDKLEKAGLKISGLSPDGNLPEIVELKGHPWFVGVQFHPEFKSRPFAPHPLFVSFVEASLSTKKQTKNKAA